MELYQNILKLSCWPLVLTLKFFRLWSFLKNKQRPGSSLLALFSAWILKKIFLTLCSINWPNFMVWLLLLLKTLANMSIVIIWVPVCHVINFEINLSFLIKPVSYMTKKSGQKIKHLKGTLTQIWKSIDMFVFT